MALTSNQKHYIKKNIKTLEIKKIAFDLGLKEDLVLNYLKKQLPEKKFQKLIKQETSFSQANESENSPKNFLSFFSENIWLFVLFFFLIFISYLNSFGNAFVSDDIATISKNPEIGKFSTIFNYPIGLVSHFINFFVYHLFELNPFFFRLTNLFFHTGTVFVLFFLINFLTNKKFIAFSTALIFAVHPILTESIVWISGAPYLQYSFFFLLSFLNYLIYKKTPKKNFYLYSILFLFLSLLSSDKAIVLFLIFFSYEIILGDIRNNWKKIAPHTLLCFSFLIFYLFKATQRIEQFSSTLPEITGYHNPLVQIPIAISIYLKLIFWPDDLSFYQKEVFTFSEYLFSFLIFLVFIIFTTISFKKSKRLFFWLTFFVITLLPTLTPLKVAFVTAERYVYLGSIGIFIAFSLFLNKFKEKLSSRKIIPVTLTIIILALSSRTIVRNLDWTNEDSLWIATAKVSSSRHELHNNLGDVYGRQGKHKEAIDEFKKATEINPRYAEAFHNLGNAYLEINNTQEALASYQKALEINPNLWQSYQNISAIYLSQKEFQKAQEAISKAIEINPENQELKKAFETIKAGL